MRHDAADRGFTIALNVVLIYRIPRASLPQQDTGWRNRWICAGSADSSFHRDGQFIRAVGWAVIKAIAVANVNALHRWQRSYEYRVHRYMCAQTAQCAQGQCRADYQSLRAQIKPLAG